MCCKIFQTIKKLRDLDGVKKVISVSDTATTDNRGATVGLIRVLACES